jgi:uncharacterized protein YdeI (YjbR/CyaY-like superfamily)
VKTVYFRSSVEFRAWLEKHHEKADEVWVGFYSKASGRTGIGYEESVNEALCFGWIDGKVERVDEGRHVRRFTRRRPRSIWSRSNIERVETLMKRGQMQSAGLEAYNGRDPKRVGIYSFENEAGDFDAAGKRKFKENRKAWKFFASQPPGYRRTATFWVMSAKKEETRARRLEQLMADSEKGRRLVQIAGKRSEV